MELDLLGSIGRFNLNKVGSSSFACKHWPGQEGVKSILNLKLIDGDEIKP
jgi:hypothetical protein